MADKEERILIQTYTPICNHLKCVITEYHDGYVDEEEICKLTHEKCEPKNCKNKVFSGMTRQEAINKIRIAMHKVFIKQEQARPLFLNYAEAALNALLEGGKK